MFSQPHTPALPHSHLRRDIFFLFAFAIVINGLAARFVVLPGYMDAYYYFGGALQLARGHGFTEPYLWNYLASNLSLLTSHFPPPTSHLPYPSHLYWMPLTSLVAAPFIAAAGVDRATAELFRIAQVPFILLASALPLLSYLVATLTTGLRRHAIAAALLTLFSGFHFVFWTNTDAFALYGLTAGGALLAVGLSRRGAASGLRATLSTRQLFFIAGVLSGLAHLTRADGLLILFIVLWFALRPRTSNFGLRTSDTGPWTPNLGLATLAGYLLITLPWFLRNLLVVGSPLGPGGARMLWLTEYNDLFNYPAGTLTLARYLAAGWPAILLGKWSALVLNTQTLIAAQGVIVASPFIAIGLWRLRRSPLYRPAMLYGLTLFALMTFAFSFPGARGGYFHSGAALLPFFFPAALVGLDASVEAAARVLRHWQPQKSKPVFAALLVAGAIAFTLLVFQSRVVGSDWRHPKSAESDAVYGRIGEALAEMGDHDSVVAANDPPAFYFFTGHPSIVVPNGEADTLLRAMSDFGARWLVLDVNHPAGLAGLYAAPSAEPRLALRATFTDNAGQPVYLFELK